MKKLLYLIMALSVTACAPKSNKFQATSELNSADSLLVAEFYKPYIQSKFGNDTIAIRQFIRQEAESLDSCYLIHYKQPINGYDIRMGIKDKYQKYEEVECYGNMIISNEGKAICDTFNIYLSDSVYNGLATHKINELDYVETLYTYYDNAKYPHLGQFHKMPFAFFDTDFDGEKELILRVQGAGQRHRDCYCSISLVWENPCHWIDDCALLFADDVSKENYRYFPFDDMTQFDSKNKVFIFHQSVAVWGNEWHYYKIENGKGKLVKKIIEYDHIEPSYQEPKVMRITYHGNDSTVTNIPVGKDYSYSID